MKLQKKFKLTLFAGLGLMMGALGFADGGDGSGDDALTAAAHPVFTAEQAEAGEVVYQQSCAACHFGQLQGDDRSEEHTSELQSRGHLVCRLLLEKKKKE